MHNVNVVLLSGSQPIVQHFTIRPDQNANIWCSYGKIMFFFLLNFYVQQSCLELFSSSSCTLLARFPFLWKDLTNSVSFYECPPNKEHLFLFKSPMQRFFFFLPIYL